MRILIAGDTHGRESRLGALLRRHPEARALLFLGDGGRAAARELSVFPAVEYAAVRGNNDWASPDPDECTQIYAGRRLWMTHGHLQEVKRGLERLTAAARARGADVALFGHTHTPLTHYDGGLYLLNPGSLGYGGTYGVVDITAAGIAVHIAALDG